MFRLSIFLISSLTLILFEVNGKKFLVKTGDEEYETKDEDFDTDDEDTPRGGDYRDDPTSTQHVTIGGETQLRCDSRIPFQGCKFRSPNGQLYDIGIGGASSYHKSRIDCLCMEEKYDPTTVCGIYIKDLKREDTGTWRCMIEFKKNGKKITKTATKYLQVGRDPYQGVQGGFIKNTGEYIQKDEIDLRPDNLIKVLPSLGSEYKIIFDVFINKFNPSTWYSVLLFTVDKGRRWTQGSIKYGDRHPAVFVRDNRLWIKSAVNGNSNYFKNFSIEEKWMKIEICQHIIYNKLTFEIKINRKTVHKVEQRKPCLFKGVSVFAGMPSETHQTAKGKIKNLYYETSDQTNYGSCVVDLRPRPVKSSGVLQDSELVLKKNQLITVLPYIGREYFLSFELYLNSYQSHKFANVIHFTRGGNYGTYGDRNPAIWIRKDKRMHIVSSIAGNHNFATDPNIISPLKTWFPVTIRQYLDNGGSKWWGGVTNQWFKDSPQFIYNVTINGKTVISRSNHVATMFTDVKVYAGDPWHPAQDGKIRNLVLKTKGDGICINQGQK